MLTGLDDVRLWRAIAVFRGVALVYAVALFVDERSHYRHVGWAWVTLAALAAWTVVMTLATAWPARDAGTPGRGLLVADLLVSAAGVLVSRVLDRPEWIRFGSPTLPTIWVAATVLGWAVWRGRRGGLVAAVVLAVCDLVEAGRPATATSTTTLNSVVLLLLTGLIVGYAIEVVRAGRAETAAAVAAQAATAERERLARDIHDSVLQVLGLVHREGLNPGSESSRLPELAGDLEVQLRTLITTGLASSPDTGPDAPDADLRATLSRHAAARVTVSAPAQPVVVPAAVVRALDAATAAALDNVRRHAGPEAKTWILLESEPGLVTVSVRDDGPGLPPGRLEAARAEGRIGVSGSIVGRIGEVGGAVEIVSAPGQGTEIEMRVPVGGSAGE